MIANVSLSVILTVALGFFIPNVSFNCKTCPFKTLRYNIGLSMTGLSNMGFSLTGLS